MAAKAPSAPSAAPAGLASASSASTTPRSSSPTPSSVIVVPGYGLAVAQAQHGVRELAELLEARGVDVKYAIHPVAGRMPGHMNVLLAEANVPYPQLKEMEDINPEFDRCDVALVIGANDVTNPAARRPGSPVSGMPILDVDHAKNIIVMKRSMGRGYAGIDNELYANPKTGMLFADAKAGLADLIAAVKALGRTPAASRSRTPSPLRSSRQARNPGTGVHGPARAVEPERELGEAQLEVGRGVAGQEPVEVLGLDAHAPLDLRRVAADLVAPAAQRGDRRLELLGPVREGRVPGVRVARDEPRRPPHARCPRSAPASAARAAG